IFDSRSVAPDAQIRQAVELRRAMVSRDMGTISELRTRLESHGIGPELCSAAGQPPSIPPTAITLTSDDYPRDLLRYGIMGQTTVELAVGATGQIEGQRVIASQPSGFFDSVAMSKLRAVRLFPAQQNGAPTGCRGMVQNIRWQVPAGNEGFEPFNGFLDQMD
ncbi:MAG: TonB family protein, partial [Rhizorhabdus sp.]